jgi:monoamine oxidase
MPDRTLIIGAGAAGLAAASRLRDADRPVLVLEARDRVGGRVATDRTHGVIELGAEFIHGANVRSWELLRRFALPTRPMMDTETPVLRFVDSEGQIKRASPAVIERYTRLFSAVTRYTGDPAHSAADVLATLAGDDAAAARFVQLWLERFEAADTRRLSARLMADERAADTSTPDDFRLTVGYDRLITAMARGLDIRLSMPVTTVSYTSTGVEVRTADGAQLEGANAIIAVPLSQLKAGRIIFDPALSAEKRKAIDAIGMGPSIKLILRFKRVCWPRFSFMTGPDARLVFWPAVNDTAALIGFGGGRTAPEIVAMGEAGATEYWLGQLAAMLGPQVYSEFADSQLVDWSAERYIEMGYTWPAIGSAGAREVLAEPVDNRLFFAGEASALDHDYATVHGAIGSGWRAADQILRS